MKQSVTITVNQLKIEKMKRFYAEHIVENNGMYVLFQAKIRGIVITAYDSKKETFKVTFMGEDALGEAQTWDENAKVNEKKAQIVEEWICLEDQIGSDEVGVGDFVLPMIVVAAFVRKKDIDMLKQFNVHDSKKLKDDQIREIGAGLTKKVFISKLTLSNEKYNEMCEKGENLNSLKAKMHNRALLNMFKQFPDTKNIFVDQFVKEETYYRYLNDKNEVQIDNITFKTKGESSYPSVALASVMARYAFLKEKDALEKKYKMEFPLGASIKADEFARKFIYKYGIKEFDKICKKNFANYKEATEISLWKK